MVSKDHSSEHISVLLNASLFCSIHQYLWLVFISILLVEVYVQVSFHLKGPTSSFSDTPRCYCVIRFRESHGAGMTPVLKVMSPQFSPKQKKDWDCHHRSLLSSLLTIISCSLPDWLEVTTDQCGACYSLSLLILKFPFRTSFQRYHGIYDTIS